MGTSVVPIAELIEFVSFRLRADAFKKDSKVLE